MFYDVLWCSLMFFDVLWCSMMFYDILWCSMMFYDVLWWSMIFYGVLWCSMMFYDVLWCSMVFYDVLRAFLVSSCQSVPPEFFRSFLSARMGKIYLMVDWPCKPQITSIFSNFVSSKFHSKADHSLPPCPFAPPVQCRTKVGPDSCIFQLHCIAPRPAIAL